MWLRWSKGGNGFKYVCWREEVEGKKHEGMNTNGRKITGQLGVNGETHRGT